MTLIELLCVIAIIALLAALLLPAVGQAKARSKRIECTGHLHQVGVGFVNFANDHNGRFPMAVLAAEGGSLEFATNGYRLVGDFYFSFRHFQVLSNELSTPKVVVCPADSRPAAVNFAALSNERLSYFVGVNAEFSKPGSILAGDRNLTNDFASLGTLANLGPNSVLRWTRDLHQFKGNLLFSDAHVEEKNNAGLLSVVVQLPVIADLALPTSPRAGTPASSPGLRGTTGPTSVSSPSSAAGPPADAKRTDLQAPAATNDVMFSARSATPRVGLPLVAGSAPEQAPPSRLKETETGATNAMAAANLPAPAPGDASVSTVGFWPAAVMQNLLRHGMWWLYLLLLLIAIAALVLRRLARGKKEGARKVSASVDSHR